MAVEVGEIHDELRIEVKLSDLINGQCSPALFSWFLRARAKDFENDGLSKAVTALVSVGRASRTEEAIGIIDGIAQAQSQRGSGILTTGQLKGRLQRSPAWRTIDDFLKIERPEIASTRTYGVYGHTALSQLMEGRVKPPRQGIKVYSQPLFGDFRRFDLDNTPLVTDYCSAEATDLSGQIGELLQSLAGASNDRQLWESSYDEYQLVTGRLHQLLGRFYGAHVDMLATINKHNLPSHHYLQTLTLMTWGQAVLAKTRENPTLAPIYKKELPVLSKHDLHLDGGRIDLLEVTSIDGSSPSPEQQLQIERFFSIRQPTLSHLTYQLWSHFHKPLRFLIRDLKVAVGDGLSHVDILNRARIPSGGVKSHLDQVSRYCLLAELGWVDYLKRHKKIDRRLWSQRGFFQDFDLVYFTPDALPQAYSHHLVSKERERLFAHLVAYRYMSAESQHLAQRVESAIPEFIDREIQLYNLSKQMGRPLPRASAVLDSLSTATGSERGIVKYIQPYFQKGRIARTETGVSSSQEPVDLLNERINYKGKTVYDLNLKRYAKEIDPRVLSGQTGHYTCPNPDHRDSTPSYHIKFETGTCKCFGCGLEGRILLGSVPTDLAEAFNGESSPRLKYAPGELVDIPTEHDQFMRSVQEVMRESFRLHPQGRDYLVFRGLDPDLAFRHGVGFGKGKYVTSRLLDTYSLDALIHYGLFTFPYRGAKFTDRDSLYQTLLRQGFTPPQLTRNSQGGIEGRRHALEFGLEDYLSWPLTTLDGKVTNLYGRYTGDRLGANSHFKTSTGQTHLPQTGYNLEALAQTGAITVITEAVLCAESFRQSFLRLKAQNLYTGPDVNFAAVVGTRNDFLIKQIIDSNANIGFNLDHDTEGPKAVADNLRSLEDNNFAGQAVDMAPLLFSNDALAFHPDLARCKDPNAILMACGPAVMDYALLQALESLQLKFNL